MLHWDVYEITSEAHSLNGVMLRGRIRKFSLEKEIDVLVENTEDIENGVRFAVMVGTEIQDIKIYLQSILPDVKIIQVRESLKNPVLSKLKVNQEDRYTL